MMKCSLEKDIIDINERREDPHYGKLPMTYLAWLIFIGAAILEVGGDAVVRKGLRGSGLIIILIGFAMLGCYGVVVNMVKWDFSKLLGVYVAVFACISILFGRFVFKENISLATWIGLAVIVCGGMIIQFGDLMKQ
jgi:drug/metabolite transporter (DMT)-like permease